MKKILIPVDFSEHSEFALKTAATLAKKHNASLVVLHMMGLSEAVLTKDESKEMPQAIFYMKLAEKRFADFLDKEFLKGVKVETTVQNYKEFHEINDVAKEFKADLIVMGSHGASGLKEVFVGSNTEKVVRSSTIPVLVVKNNGKDFKLNKVVFASDFKVESVATFKRAMRFFEVLSIEVKLVYINKPSENFVSTKEIDKRILDFIIHITEYNLIPENVTIYSDYSIERGIFNYAEKINADLICIPTHGRSGLAHFFAGSIGEDIVNHSSTPVLTFKI